MKGVWGKILTAVIIAAAIGVGTILMSFYNSTKESNRDVPLLKEADKIHTEKIQQNYDNIISLESKFDKNKAFQIIKDTLMQTKMNYMIMKIENVLDVVKENHN